MSWAAVAGAAVGVVGNQLGSKSGGSTTTTNSPWSGTQPYLTGGYRQAEYLLNQGINPQTQGALSARGMGSQTDQAAQNLATSTLRGDYLNSNPFTQGAVNDAMGMAKSQINSQFAGNNYGSSAHQEWLGRGLMNASLPYLNQNYENERGRQFAALSQAPALQGMDYQNIQAQQQADMMPFDLLGRYQQVVGGLPSGGGNTTTPYFTNPVNSALGGAMLGNQLYNSYTNNQQPNNWGMNSQTASSFPW